MELKQSNRTRTTWCSMRERTPCCAVKAPRIRRSCRLCICMVRVVCTTRPPRHRVRLPQSAAVKGGVAHRQGGVRPLRRPLRRLRVIFHDAGSPTALAPTTLVVTVTIADQFHRTLLRRWRTTLPVVIGSRLPRVLSHGCRPACAVVPTAPSMTFVTPVSPWRQKSSKVRSKHCFSRLSLRRCRT